MYEDDYIEDEDIPIDDDDGDDEIISDNYENYDDDPKIVQ